MKQDMSNIIMNRIIANRTGGQTPCVQSPHGSTSIVAKTNKWPFPFVNRWTVLLKPSATKKTTGGKIKNKVFSGSPAEINIKIMNTTYRSKKQVTRLMAASSHTLSLLMSMLRVSLEAAWSMARVWLEYAYSIFITRFLRPFSSKRAELERRLVCNEILASFQ